MNGITSPALSGPRNLGIQPALTSEDRKHFVPFSVSTQGKCGRPVYIDTRLLPQFLALVDIDTSKGQRLVRGIEALRALGGGIGAFQSASCAAKHMSLVEDVEVYYFIEQAQKGAASGVYVTKLKQNHIPAADKANVYLEDKYNLTPTNNTFISLDNSAIICANSVGQAATESRDFAAKDGWGQTASREILFIPSELLNEEGSWLTPSQKRMNPQQIETVISATLDKTQTRQQKLKNGEKLHIQIHGDAVKFLNGALSKSNAHIDSLDFQFIDPTGRVDQALQKINHRNGSSTKPIIATNKRSLISLTQIKHQLEQLFIGAGQKQQMESVSKATLSTSKTLNTVRFSTSPTFINAIKQANKLGRWAK